MWIVLRGEEYKYVTRRNVICFLFAINGLVFDLPKDISIISSNNNNNGEIEN